MFFTRMSHLFAILALLLGIYQIAIGITISAGLIGPEEEALRRYTPVATTGKAINQGIYTLLAAALLGTLAEIGYAVRRPEPSADAPKTHAS